MNVVNGRPKFVHVQNVFDPTFVHVHPKSVHVQTRKPAPVLGLRPGKRFLKAFFF
jgi:hypothetical protein